MIALIDDDASVRKAFGRLLRAAGFDTCAFSSGEEFLSTCNDHMPECVILDMHMPGMSGLEIQRRLTDLGACVPMVVITADDEWSSYQACMDHGATAFLRKPVDGPDLLSCLNLAIAHPRGVELQREVRLARALP